MNALVKKSLGVGLVAALSMFGCTNPAGTRPSASGSAALSQDDALLYVADRDNGVLAVIDTASDTVLAQAKVGKDPMRVLVGTDDTIYVANRGERSVSVLHRGDWNEAARLQVGVEPSGLALTPDGRSLLVTSATSEDSPAFGTLTSFDTATLQKNWELPVGEEPRAVAVTGDGSRALVSLFKQGDVVEVDLNKAVVTKNSAGLYGKANASQLDSGNTAGPSTFKSRAMADLVATPDGTRVFAPVVWAREDNITRAPTTSGGYYQAGGPCSVGAVAAAGIVTFDTGGNSVEPKVDDLTACTTSGGGGTASNRDFPTSTLFPKTIGSGGPLSEGIQGPTVAAVDPTGNWLFVVNRESRNLAVMPVYRRTGGDLHFDETATSVRTVVDIGNGADGIALSRDGATAYVYNQFDHTVNVLKANGRGDSAILAVVKTIPVAEDVLPADIVAGRKMFYDARNPNISNPITVVACSTCHLEGREDGHVWQFPDGPRQTPALAGRGLKETAPYHWSGEFATLSAFSSHTIRERMGGSGLSDADSDKLDAFIESLPVAENPIAKNDPSALRGRQVFEQAGCATCHTGAFLTDNQNADVGTTVRGGNNPDEGLAVTQGFNIPSLLGVGRSAPYLHSGAQSTLEARVYDNPGDQHGVTSNLDEGQKRDLVRYLQSL